MRGETDGVSFEYELSDRFDCSERTVIFLHGWGGGLASFKAAFDSVAALGINCVNFAFPKEVPDTYGIYDYAALVEKFIVSINLDKPVVVGHSFGGRVGMILASKGITGGLVLTGAAGMKPRPSLKKKIAIMRYRSRVKHGKPLDGFGSADYNNTSGGMRKVFVRIVNTHLEKVLPDIDCKTLIVWGKADKDTPPYMARRIKRGIKNSRIVYLDGGHYAYVDSHYKFVRELKSFLVE